MTFVLYRLRCLKHSLKTESKNSIIGEVGALRCSLHFIQDFRSTLSSIDLDEGTLMLVVEYYDHGDLCGYVQCLSPEGDLFVIPYHQLVFEDDISE